MSPTTGSREIPIMSELLHEVNASSEPGTPASVCIYIYIECWDHIFPVYVTAYIAYVTRWGDMYGAGVIYIAYMSLQKGFYIARKYNECSKWSEYVEKR